MKKFILSALLCTSAQAMALADISLPGDLFYPGSITIVDPGLQSHAKVFKVCLVEYSKQNDVSENKLTRCTTHNLNEEIHLPAGTYYLELQKDADNDDRITNHSTMLVTLQEGQRLPITLASQQISRSNGEFSASLFRDLSKDSEVDRFLQIKWANGLDGTNYRLFSYFYTADWYCRKKKMRTAEVQACRAFKAKNYQGLKDAFKFNKDGTFDLVEIQDYVDQDKKLDPDSYSIDYRAWEVIGLRDGDTIAVFPGLYGARFNNSVGYGSTTLGIEFKN